MDRIIEIKVGGNYLTKDSKNAGVRGEYNVTNLRITFDEGWDEFDKTITFWNARGENPVSILLTKDLLEKDSTRVYLVPIPSEPMAEAGMFTFVIDGYTEGKKQRTVADRLEVKDSPKADDAGESAEPTPTLAEQLQKRITDAETEIESIKNAMEDNGNALVGINSNLKKKIADIYVNGVKAETNESEEEKTVAYLKTLTLDEVEANMNGITGAEIDSIIEEYGYAYTGFAAGYEPEVIEVELGTLFEEIEFNDEVVLEDADGNMEFYSLSGDGITVESVDYDPNTPGTYYAEYIMPESIHVTVDARFIVEIIVTDSDQ